MKLNNIQKEQLSSGLIKTQDFHQRRITNAAPSQNLNDYVIQEELALSIISTTEADFKTKARINRLYIFNNQDDNLKYLALFDGTNINFIFNF